MCIPIAIIRSKAQSIPMAREFALAGHYPKRLAKAHNAEMLRWSRILSEKTHYRVIVDELTMTLFAKAKEGEFRPTHQLAQNTNYVHARSAIQRPSQPLSLSETASTCPPAPKSSTLPIAFKWALFIAHRFAQSRLRLDYHIFTTAAARMQPPFKPTPLLPMQPSSTVLLESTDDIAIIAAD